MAKRWRSLTWVILMVSLSALALFTAGCSKEEKPDPGAHYYEGKDFTRPGSSKGGKAGAQ